MIDRVAGFISRYSMFPPNARVGVAVSGGADSVCLLHLVAELRARWNLHLTVVHVNHLLRGPDSDADEQFVRDLTGTLGLPLLLERIDVGVLASASRANLEQTARDVRRRVFQRELECGRLDRIALAHTRSDQAETVLFRFLRGSHTTGLSGMRPVTGDGLVRPLLEITRPEVERFLRERGLAWREDLSNQNLHFARNRIRHQLLPALSAEWNPNLPTLLAREAVLAREDEEYWESEVARLAPELLNCSGGVVIVDVRRFESLPNAVARRILRHAIGLVRGNLRQIDSANTGKVLELVRRPPGHQRLQLPGVDILRSFHYVRFSAAPASPPAGFDIPLPLPGAVSVPGSALSLVAELIDTEAQTRGRLETDLDWNCIRSATGIGDGSRGESLILRNWRPGDAYRRVGDPHIRKFKELFHLARIPVWERRLWPVLTACGQILWSRKFGPASQYVAGQSSATVLRISEKNRVSESAGSLLTSL